MNNGSRTITVHENCIEYWEAIGYQVGKKETKSNRKAALAGYVQLHKGDENISVPKDEVEKYLSAGWHKGRSQIKICSLDGKVKTICKDELEKYLSKNWVLFGLSKLAREQQKIDRQNPDKVRVTNSITEAYIDKEQLELFQQHGWKIGMVYVYEPGTRNRKVIPYDELFEYLAKGYTR